MGVWYLVSCSNCNYEVNSSAGLDEGFAGKVQTHACYGCNSLVDILIEPNKSWKNNSPSSKCHKCNSDKIFVWDPKDRPCPRCCSQMTIGDNPIAMWD